MELGAWIGYDGAMIGGVEAGGYVHVALMIPLLFVVFCWAYMEGGWEA
jgi:hypothetical protein